MCFKVTFHQEVKVQQVDWVVAFPSLANIEGWIATRTIPANNRETCKKATLTVFSQRRKIRLQQVKLHPFFFAQNSGWEGTVPLIGPVVFCHSRGVIFKLHFHIRAWDICITWKTGLMNAAFEMEKNGVGLDTGCMKCAAGAAKKGRKKQRPWKWERTSSSNSSFWIMYRGADVVKIMSNIVWWAGPLSWQMALNENRCRKKSYFTQWKW